jgi:ABC-type uncharacterized transport system permease subunit
VAQIGSTVAPDFVLMTPYVAAIVALVALGDRRRRRQT